MARLIRCDHCKREMETLSAWAAVQVQPNPEWKSGLPRTAELCDTCLELLHLFLDGKPLEEAT